MRVLLRFRVDPGQATSFLDELRQAHRLLAAKPGYVDGDIGRNLDEPDLWLFTTRWADVGSYRRALNAYDVKAHAHVLLGGALDEPSAYEDAEEDLNDPRPRVTGR